MKTPSLIGHAGQLLDLLSVTLANTPRIKVLFAGNPGVGKSEISRQLAHELCGGKFAVEEIIGRKASVHHVYAWEESFASSSLFGNGRRIVVINEIDTLPKDSADALLALLDNMPAGRGIIGTTNLPFSELSERFRSRFTKYDVRSPADEEIAALLESQEGLPPAIALHVAALAGGNVREAIMSADAWRCENAPAKAPAAFQTSLAALGL